MLIRKGTIFPAALLKPLGRFNISRTLNMAHHAGPDDSWHGKIEPNGPFPPEDGRYHLYIGTVALPASSGNELTELYRLILPFRYVRYNRPTLQHGVNVHQKPIESTWFDT